MSENLQSKFDRLALAIADPYSFAAYSGDGERIGMAVSATDAGRIAGEVSSELLEAFEALSWTADEITAERNRLREQVAALTLERDAWKATAEALEDLERADALLGEFIADRFVEAHGVSAGDASTGDGEAKCPVCNDERGRWVNADDTHGCKRCMSEDERSAIDVGKLYGRPKDGAS